MRAPVLSFNFRENTGIYVGARAVYIAQLKATPFGLRLVKFGQAEIKTPLKPAATVGELSKGREQAIVVALRKVLRENNITVQTVYLALAGKDVLVRYFQMPRIPRAEWATAVKFEAKKYIPFKIEELFWDFYVVSPKLKASKMEVTFVGAKKEVGKAWLSILQQAGLKAAVLEPASFSLLRLLTLGGQLSKEKAAAIVDVDYGVADINIVKDNVCYLTRDIALPLEGAGVFEHLLNEMRMSLDYYEKLFPAETIGKLVLCGETDLKDWDKRLAQELKLPVERVNPVKVLKTEGPAPLPDTAVAIGLTLHNLVQTATNINLYQLRKAEAKVSLGKDLKQALTFQEVRLPALRALLLSGIALLALHLVMLRQIKQEEKQLEQLTSFRPKAVLSITPFADAKITELKQELENRLSVLNMLVDERVFWSAKFNKLAKLVPPGIWLTDLSISERLSKDNLVNRNLTIKGAAYHQEPVREIELVTKFVSNLKTHQGFADGFAIIKLEAMTSGAVQAMPVKQFSISCLKK